MTEARRFGPLPGATGYAAHHFIHHDGEWVSATADLPDGWVGSEHHVAGATPDVNGNPFSVGFDATAPSRVFSGAIREARVYDRVLTVDEITDANRAAEDPSLRFWFDAATAGHEVDEPEPGATYLAYGGDWGDSPNDGNGLADGILDSDRAWDGKADEVKKVYQPVQFRAGRQLAENREVRITNENLFTHLNDYRVEWRLVADGEIVQDGVLPRGKVDVAPLSSESVEIPFRMPRNTKPGTEYFLELDFRTTHDTEWAEAGFSVASEQLALDLGSPAVKPTPPADVDDVTVDESDDAVRVSGTGFDLTVDKSTGVISRYTAHGKDLITSGPQPNFWRGPTDNDLDNFGGVSATWQHAGADRTVDSVEVTPLDDQAVRIAVRGTLPTSTTSQYSTTYTVFGNSEVRVDNALRPGSADVPQIPEVGTMLTLPADLTNVAYYGRGPDENYVDRARGSDVGVYSSTVDEMGTDYIRPQENGHRTDTRWVALTDDDGIGLLASAKTTMGFNASHHTPEDLSQGTRHAYQVQEGDDVVLRLSEAQMGVGGTFSETEEKYRLRPDSDYEYSYRLRPITAHDDPFDVSRQATSID